MSVRNREKRRYWTRAQKEEILRAYDEEGISLAEFSRKHEVHPVMLYKWRRKMIQKKESLPGFSKGPELLVELENKMKENENLKRAVGELVVEKQILKTANEILKKDTIRCSMACQRDDPKARRKSEQSSDV